MNMICEKCGKEFSVSEGEYVIYKDIMMFACKPCAKRIDDEIKCARKVCAAINGKKAQAEVMINNKEACNKLLGSIEETLKKPGAGKMTADVLLLSSLMEDYINEDYKDISFNAAVGILATLLYVISPIDLIPDMIPLVGFSDDVMAVALCKNMIRKDLEKYNSWKKRHLAEA